MNRALLLVALLGCSSGERNKDEHQADVPRRYRDTAAEQVPVGTPRERDCAAVRDIVERVAFDIVPSAGSSDGIRDEGQLAKLKQVAYADAAVKQAALDMVDTSAQAFYARADEATVAKARAAYERLAAMCGIKRTP
jgi:hypothetical protein